jgi:AcrR family transcriptional regulator
MITNNDTTISENPSEDQIGGRELILQEATRLFVKQGYNGISMREIAEACHMTKAALYYHFKDKEDLLRSIFTTYLDKLSRDFSETGSQTDSARSRLTNLVNEIFEQSPEKRAVLHLMFVELPHLDRNLQQEIGSLYHSQFQGTIETILSQGIKNGELRGLEPRIAARLLIGMMYPLFHPRNFEQEQEIPESVASMINVFFDGVTARE